MMKLLSKYVEFKNGKKRPTSKGTIPVYGGNGILDYTNTANMQSGVVIGRVGVYCGSVFLVREKCWVSDNAIKAMCKENMDLGYLYYLLSSLHLNERRIGTSQPLLTQSILNNIEVEIPELAIQKKISSILELLDEKIKLNNEINNNLEQQAQAIFKSWFIDLEPFSNRKPSDWSVSTLGNVSIMGAGGDKPQNVSPIKTDLYKYPIYSNGLSNEGLYGFTDKPKISEESVTVSARGTIGFVCLRHIPYVPIVRLVTLTPKTEIISAKYLYLWLKQLHITGTGTTQQQLTVPYFQKTEILVPSQEIVTLFTTTVDPIFEKIFSL